MSAFACGHIVEIEFERLRAAACFKSECHTSYLEAQLSYGTPGGVKSTPAGNSAFLVKCIKYMIPFCLYSAVTLCLLEILSDTV